MADMAVILVEGLRDKAYDTGHRAAEITILDGDDVSRSIQKMAIEDRNEAESELLGYIHSLETRNSGLKYAIKSALSVMRNGRPASQCTIKEMERILADA